MLHAPSPPAERLARAADDARIALDARHLDRAAASRQLARLARALLRAHPTDADLVAGVERLSRRRFEPPHPATLPPGDPLGVWTELSARGQADLADLAASIVAVPDPETHPDEAARLVELLVEVPAEHARAARSIEALAPHRPAGEIALWRFRLAAARIEGDDRSDEQVWDEALAPLRAMRAEAPDALAAALHLAASAVAAESSTHGAEWLAPTLGGRRLLNAYAARHRRPALAHELAPVFTWLDEARRLAVSDATDPIGWSLRLMGEADAAGRFAAADAALVDVLETGGRQDLVDALAARAVLFQSPALAARAASLGGAIELSAPPPSEGLWAALRPAVDAPATRTQGWSDAVLRLGAPGLAEVTATRPEDLTFLESAGSVKRAAQGWLALAIGAERSGAEAVGAEARQAQLQAWRLRDLLTSDERSQLADALGTVTPDDELELHADDALRGLAACRLELLEEGLEREGLALRLRVGAAADAPHGGDGEGAEGDGPVAASDDPHSAANRLAAGADLIDEGRPDAAAAVLTSLFKRCDDEDALPQLVALSATLLQRDEPPADLVQAVARALDRQDALGSAMLSRLAEDPLAAFPLHTELRAGGLDRRRSDVTRTRMLATWLGIWRATGTPPDPGNLHDPMHVDPALLPLAAAQLAGGPDPVSDAARFLIEHPPLRTVPQAYGEALLALAATPGG